MTRQEVQQIIDELEVPHPTEKIELVETHISWVLLADQYVYKIKKPVSLGFLNFSTLQLRKKYCDKEVQLNRRLAPSMYLDVLPIAERNGTFCIMEECDNPLDYCVLMLRMDESQQLDLLLERREVEPEEIKNLAEVVAHFHQGAEVIEEGEDWMELYREFADISRAKKFVQENFGEAFGQLFDEQKLWAKQFLRAIEQRIVERNRKGFIIDGHGDLHCRNIFLLDPPVIFDCIEFNDDFRKLDLLNEIAFLCMDLERLGHKNLSDVFRDHYLLQIACIENNTDWELFVFYKIHRANVRIKIHVINAQRKGIPERVKQEEIQLISRYLELSAIYFSALKDGSLNNSVLG